MTQEITIGDVARARRQLERLKEELDKIRTMQCPFCGHTRTMQEVENDTGN